MTVSREEFIDYLQYIPITEENHEHTGEQNVPPHQKLTHLEVGFL